MTYNSFQERLTVVCNISMEIQDILSRLLIGMVQVHAALDACSMINPIQSVSVQKKVYEFWLKLSRDNDVINLIYALSKENNFFVLC